MTETAEIVRRLIAASDGYRRALATLLGVSVPEVLALEALYHDGPLTPTAIAGRIGVSTASVTGLVDRLGQLATRTPPTGAVSWWCSPTADARSCSRWSSSSTPHSSTSPPGYPARCGSSRS